MKAGFSITLLFIVFCVLVAPVMAGIYVGNVNVRPSGDLESGKTNVSADFDIGFIPIGSTTFPSDQSIILTTELDNPVWTYSIILDGIENPRPASSKKQLDLSGWELSYENKDQSLKVNLKGIAPKTDKSKQIQIAGVGVASGGRTTDTVKEVMAYVTNPGELKGNISSVKERITDLQNELAQHKADGIDVSKADEKVKEALASLNSASGAGYTDAQVYMKNAETQMKEANTFIDMGIAKKTIQDAKDTIDKTDEWITYFQTDMNLGADPRLTPIITRREFAAEDVSDAQALYDEGKYTDARKKAETAYGKASDVFEATQTLHTELESAPATTGLELPDLSGILTYVIGIIVVLVIGAGAFLFLKNRGGKGGGKGGGGSFGSRDKPKKKKTAHQYDELF